MLCPNQVETVKGSLRGIRATLHALSQMQDKMIYSYTQDVHMAERNYEKIGLWSLAHLLVLVAIGAVQVFMIKGLFADKTFGYRLVAGMVDA